MDPCAAEAQAVIDAYAADAIAEANLAVALANYAACRVANPVSGSGATHGEVASKKAAKAGQCVTCAKCPTCGK